MLMYLTSVRKLQTGIPVRNSVSYFVPDMLPGMNCRCVDIRMCPAVCRFLQIPETSTFLKRHYLKNITCGFKGFMPYVCCDENTPISGDNWRLRDDFLPFHHQFPIQIPPQYYPTETLEPSESHYPHYPFYPAYSSNHVTTLRTTTVIAQKLLPKECGMSLQDRILGGKKAALGAYPWIARIGYRRPGSQKIQYRCGGSLINDRYVITAAHCVSKLPGNLTLTSVRLGEVDERTDPDCNKMECADLVQDFSVDEVRIHRDYDIPRYQNDIALIRLSRPANISVYVSPICLPLDHPPFKNYTGQKATVAGWGATNVGMSTGGKSPELMWVRLSIVPPKQCFHVFESRAKVTLSGGQICAGGEKEKDSCEGDSGGPLMSQEQGEDSIPKYVLIGLVSFGAKQCGSDNVPGVYTKVRTYLDWILNNMRP